MKFGKVLTYKDIDEAEKLEGKNVVASDNLYLIENEEFCREYATLYKLTLARKGLDPFTVSDDNKFQFIREVIEDESDPHYEPYDLSDPKVRDSLRGRWYKWEGPDGTREEMVNRILFPLYTKKWEVNGRTVEDFLKHCHWVDNGTPCGRLMNMEVR